MPSSDTSSIKSDRLREFVGKVKIVFIDSPKKVYFRKKWAAAFIALSQMLIGVNNVIILFYLLSFKSDLLMNLHIFLFTIGLQLYVPTGILSLNPLNGFTSSMSSKDIKFEHIFLQILGLLFFILGIVSVICELQLPSQITLHSILGAVAGCVLLLSAITGLCIKGESLIARVMKYIHIVTGIIGFLASSACFVTGIFRPCIGEWLPASNLFIVLFCVLYTVVISLCTPQSISRT